MAYFRPVSWQVLLTCLLLSSSCMVTSASEEDEVTISAPEAQEDTEAASEALVDDSPPEQQDIANDTVPQTPELTWRCPDGWIAYHSNDEVSCMWKSNISAKFDAALKLCNDLGGSLAVPSTVQKKQCVKDIVVDSQSDVWIGLHKESGYDAVFSWIPRHEDDDVSLPDKKLLVDSLTEFFMYKAQCVFVSSFAEEFDMDDCDTEYEFVCEKTIACESGWFGDRCDKECHCMGEPCEAQQPGGPAPICRWGCQRGWTGTACDTPLQKAEVIYYCLNSPVESTKSVYIRIYTHGVLYNDIHGLISGAPGPWCFGTEFYDESQEVKVLKFPVTDDNMADMDAKRCIGDVISATTFSWTIEVKEVEGILRENDLRVHIVCDFSRADTLTLHGQYSIEGKATDIHQKVVNAETTEEDVELHILVAHTGEEVSEATLGTSIVLRMVYGLKEGSPVHGVVPHSCDAVSPDGNFRKNLIDRHGCPPAKSPVRPFKSGEGNFVQTPWFSLFAFEGEDNVTFECSFEPCFHDPCNVGCRNDYLRRRRSAETSMSASTLQTTTRTIRVLPSIASSRSSNQEAKPLYAGDSIPSLVTTTVTHPNHDRDAPEAGPLHYLNPITCSLFLLLLVISLCMYVAFLRALHNSIGDIRKEIEIKRSRDKFLHCNCVRQKDREFVTPKIG